MTMPRPRKDDALTPENILGRMRPGDTYQANQIAAKFHLATVDIRPMLAEMVKAGQLELSKANIKSIGFRRPRTDVPATDVGELVVTSVAGPRVGSPLVGNLSGYDSEIARRTALCMLARGAR
jgi:hypothetical protein